jgi:hypothetical protein
LTSTCIGIRASPFTEWCGAILHRPERGVDEYLLFASSDAKFVAVFVAKAEAADAQRVLIQHGFTENPSPTERATEPR